MKFDAQRSTINAQFSIKKSPGFSQGQLISLALINYPWLQPREAQNKLLLTSVRDLKNIL
jgi:hypothetical protein